MNDIVERLREYVENIRAKDEPPENYLCGQAADEIEQLRALIATKDAALAFYRDGFFYEPKRSKTGVNLSEWKPKEALLEDCGNRALAALTAEAA